LGNWVGIPKWLIVIPAILVPLAILILESGFFAQPTGTLGYDFLNAFASLMPGIGYAGLFALLLVENASIPIPGELFLPIAGYYVFVGRLSFGDVLVVSSIASLLGSLIIFSVALQFGAARIYWAAAKLGITQKTLAKNEIRLCGKHGSLLIVISRFLPIYGSTIVIPAGTLQMNPVRFTLLSLVGSVASSAFFTLVGYSIGPVLQQNNNYLSELAIEYILYALVIGVAAYVGFYTLRTLKQKRAEALFLRKMAASQKGT
jgi:membrane protein DedA with SNARE-associated domain